MKPKAAEIIAKLPSLSRADLLAVKGAADALLGPQAAPIEGAATPLQAAVTRALGLKLGFAQFQRMTAYKQFKRGEQAINDFVAENFGSLDQRTEKALLGFMVDGLIEDMRFRHIPVSLATLCANLGRAAQVLRDGFPGYFESGHAGFIINRLTGGQAHVEKGVPDKGS